MKNYIYFAIGFIIVVLVSLYIGRSIGEKGQKDAQIKDRIKVIHVENKETIKKIDSLGNVIKSLAENTKVIKEKETIIREKANDIKIEKPANTTECDDLYNKSTEKIGLLEDVISKKDTIESNLNLVIDNQNNIITNKDKIISNKDLELSLTKDLAKSRNKKFTVGIQIGYGFGITSENNKVILKTVPYVGIGVSKTIFSF
jgi:hypothetical protein